MGRLILSMASRVGERPTEALVETAFEQIKERDVNKWLEDAYGIIHIERVRVIPDTPAMRTSYAIIMKK